MQFLVKVRVDLTKMSEFGQKLQQGELDRRCIRGETYCLKDDPAVGYSIWEAEDELAFEEVFSAWRPYYELVEVRGVVSPSESLRMLMERMNPA